MPNSAKYLSGSQFPEVIISSYGNNYNSFTSEIFFKGTFFAHCYMLSLDVGGGLILDMMYYCSYAYIILINIHV